MKWFFQSAAVGFLALAGAVSLYGQSTSGTSQSNQGSQNSDSQGNTTSQGTSGGVGTVPQSGTPEKPGGGARPGTGAGGQGVGTVPQSGPPVKPGGSSRPGAVQGTAGAQNAQSQYFPHNNEPWFANDSLQDELELDDDQIERLTDIHNQTRSELQGRNSGDRLNDQARAERMRELRNQFDDQFSERSRDIFRDENQRSRFNQLGMQYRGYSAFDNPRLQRELNLNDTQRRQLRDLNNSWNSELETLRGTYAGDRTGTEQRFNQLRDRTRTNFEGILNDQQRTAYDQMIGNRFDFGADAFLGQSNRPVGTGNQGSLLGTPRQPGGQGSGIGTPQDNGPQGSGIGTTTGPNDSVGGAADAGVGADTGGTGARAGTGGTGAEGTGSGGAGGVGSGSGAGGGSSSGGSGS